MIDPAVHAVVAAAAPTCTVLETADAWQTLRTHWQRLYSMTPGVTPWQHWDFLSNWWRCMADGRLLRLCVVALDGEPQLIMPLQISIVRTLGMRLRMLEPVGMPDDINRPRLALGRQEEHLYRAAFEALWRCRDDWDVLRIDEKTDGDREIQLLRKFAESQSLRVREILLHPCPYLDLQQSWTAFLASRGSHLRRNLRVAQRRLEARGRVQVHRYRGPTDIEGALESLLSVHARSWKESARVGLAQGEVYRSFYREFVRAMAQRHSVNVWVLSCNETPVAATLAVHDGTTYYSAQIAHDEAYGDCSPGTLLEAYELQGLMEERRFASYDFLGAALSNKLRWTSTARTTHRVYLARSNVRNALIDSYHFRIKPLLRRWQRRAAQSQLPSAVR